MAKPQMIYIKDSEESIWQQARTKAGDAGLSRYVNRLVRNDVIGKREQTVAELVEVIEDATNKIRRITADAEASQQAHKEMQHR